MPKVSIDGEVYDYDPSRMLNTEAMALAKVTGMKMTEWTTALSEGDAFAMTGLVWLLYRRAGRHVAFDEVEFDIGSLEIHDDAPAEAAPETPTDAPEGASAS